MFDTYSRQFLTASQCTALHCPGLLYSSMLHADLPVGMTRIINGLGTCTVDVIFGNVTSFNRQK